MKKIPVTAIIVVAIFVGFTGIVLYLSGSGANNRALTPFEKMSSRELAQVCLESEGTVMHIHSHLNIIANKQVVSVPAEIGVDEQKHCIHAVHTHDASAVIHVESPVAKAFTLGDFFAVWGMPLSKNQVLANKVDAGHALKMYVDGKESTDFENLLLKDHQDIVLDYYAVKDGPDALPKAFEWKET